MVRPLDGCVITKIDEGTSLGNVLSVVIQHAIPVAYTSNGQRVPEDISPARAHALVSRAVTLAAQAGQRWKDQRAEPRLAKVMANARH